MVVDPIFVRVITMPLHALAEVVDLDLQVWIESSHCEHILMLKNITLCDATVHVV